MNKIPIHYYIGKKFGRLTVVSFHSIINKKEVYLCNCKCGKIKLVKAEYLRVGSTKSCGCLNKELGIERRKADILYRRCFSLYKQAAKKRNYSFKLSKKQFIILCKTPCYYCGNIDFRVHKLPNKRIAAEKMNGIDRLDNNKGYIKDNCVACCYTCNKAKSTMSLNKFKEWIITVYTNLNK